MINMEHPQLPKTVDDPPTQLWVMRKDTEVRSRRRRARRNETADMPIIWIPTEQDLLAQRCYRRQSAR